MKEFTSTEQSITSKKIKVKYKYYEYETVTKIENNKATIHRDISIEIHKKLRPPDLIL